MREAAPPGKPTVDQLVDIIVAVNELAVRKPEDHRLCFAIAFAAPEEFPMASKRHNKMIETYGFLREIITLGLKRGALDNSFTVDELTQAYFHLVQHATAMGTFESRMQRGGPQVPLPPKMSPRRIVDLFTGGAAGRSAAKSATRKPRALARVASVCAMLGFCFSTASAQVAHDNTTNYPAADSTPPPVMSDDAVTNTLAAPATTNTPPDLADIRAVPNVVRAEPSGKLALVSPIAAAANDPRALDLETCFRLTAVRDDSLKISLQDVRVAQAQMSQSIAALWPTFTGTNQQQFLHYSKTSQGVSFTSLGAGTGGGTPTTTTVTETANNVTYQSQSNITMNYTVFNGGQNLNNVGAASAAIAAKRQTLARNYQTIYQDVAQAFYNVLQFQGDLVIQHDLIEALAARRAGGGFGQDEEFLQARQPVVQRSEVSPPRLDESVQLVELRHAHRGLHVGELQVVANVRIGVLVIVSAGQVAQLPTEPLAAGVVAAGFAPAVAAPVAEGFGDGAEQRRVGQNRAALAHRDVVGGIEAYRGQVAESAGLASVIGGSHGVAAIFHQP